MRKSILIIGSIAYITMAIMAIVLYKERIAFADSSFILFSILKDGELAIQVNRFGCSLTQLFPLVSSKLGFSLDNIMKIYSFSFVLYYFSIFLICVAVLKKEKFGIALLLFNVLMVTHTFYWVVPEFQQGLAMLMLYFAFVTKVNDSRLKEKTWPLPVNIMLLFTLAFFHPLMVFPFTFLIAYFYFFSKTKKKPLLGYWLAFIGFFFIKTTLFKSPYDSGAMGGLKNFISLFPNYITIKSNENFFQYLVTDYYFLIVAIIILVFYFVKQQRYIFLSFILATFIGYLLLINVSYPHGPKQFYI